MEFFEKEPVSLYISDLSLIEDANSPLQCVKLFTHPLLGNVLIINEEIHHIERYQCTYHELLVHLPIAFIKDVKKVLILGGGSLFAAYEALKYPSVEIVDLCDYDKSVLDLMGKYYSHARTTLSDKRFRHICEDAREYIKSTKNKYDLIINDCFDVLKETESSGNSMFSKLQDLLTEDGVCSDVIYRHIFEKRITQQTLKHLRKLGNICLSLVTVPEYPGILHLETLWGKSKELSQDKDKTSNIFQRECIKSNAYVFSFYNPLLLKYYLYIPPYVENVIT